VHTNFMGKHQRATNIRERKAHAFLDTAASFKLGASHCGGGTTFSFISGAVKQNYELWMRKTVPCSLLPLSRFERLLDQRDATFGEAFEFASLEAEATVPQVSTRFVTSFVVGGVMG